MRPSEEAVAWMARAVARCAGEARPAPRSPRPPRLVEAELLFELDPQACLVLPRLAFLYGIKDGTRPREGGGMRCEGDVGT